MISARAPAKLNLWLPVRGRRADGYHELDSLIAFAAAGDRLTLTPAARLALTVTGPFTAALADLPEADNLACRAVAALGARLGRGADLAVHLDKRLPVAAGLGGGSADAAAALRAAAALWELAPDAPELCQAAAALGADLPVCLAGRPARARGIGERLEPAPTLPAAPLLLVNPGVPLATPAVFRALAATSSGTGTAMRGAPTPDPPAAALAGPAELAAWLAPTGNDLTPAARALCPEIDAVLDGLGRQAGCLMARMSGSGASCWGLFDSDATRDEAAAALSAARPGWWLAPTRLAPTRLASTPAG